MALRGLQDYKQGSGIGGVGGYTPPGRKNFENTPPPEDLEKIYPPPLGGAKRRRNFLAKFWKLTLI